MEEDNGGGEEPLPRRQRLRDEVEEVPPLRIYRGGRFERPDNVILPDNDLLQIVNPMRLVTDMDQVPEALGMVMYAYQLSRRMRLHEVNDRDATFSYAKPADEFARRIGLRVRYRELRPDLLNALASFQLLWKFFLRRDMPREWALCREGRVLPAFIVSSPTHPWANLVENGYDPNAVSPWYVFYAHLHELYLGLFNDEDIDDPVCLMKLPLLTDFAAANKRNTTNIQVCVRTYEDFFFTYHRPHWYHPRVRCVLQLLNFMTRGGFSSMTSELEIESVMRDKVFANRKSFSRFMGMPIIPSGHWLFKYYLLICQLVPKNDDVKHHNFHLNALFSHAADFQGFSNYMIAKYGTVSFPPEMLDLWWNFFVVSFTEPNILSAVGVLQPLMFRNLIMQNPGSRVFTTFVPDMLWSAEFLPTTPFAFEFEGYVRHVNNL
jgi:hypothetical protein